MTWLVIPEDNRFESDPDDVLPEDPGLPEGWAVDTPDGDDPATVARLTELLRAHERAGRGWAGAGEDDVLVEVSEHGLAMRENVVVRDPAGRIRAWGSVHDRAEGRMLFVHVVDRELDEQLADRCSDVLFEWAEAQARSVGARPRPDGAADRHRRLRRRRAPARLAGGRRLRPGPHLVADEPVGGGRRGRAGPRPGALGAQGRRLPARRAAGADGMPDEADLRAVHDVLEGAFTDHFNSAEETFHEFIHRLREDPGHRWDHWWLAEITDGDGEPEPAGALVGTVSESATGPDGSYVSYLGVLESARGRGVAKGLLRTIIADAASRGRDRVGLEVDADSPTGADGLYTSMGWGTKYVTESWHRDVPVD